jgi:fatty-acyl-CoA synthase
MHSPMPGSKPSAFLPSYGLAEATLAVTIMPPGEGIMVELVEETRSFRRGRRRGPSAALSRHRQLRQAGEGHGGRNPRRGWLAARRRADRQGMDHRAIQLMVGYFRDDEATAACMVDGWLDTGDMGYMSTAISIIVGRAKDMIIINGKNHWPQDIEWAVEQLPGFKQGDIAAFAITTPNGEEAPAVLVHCRTSDDTERARLRDQIRDRVAPSPA